MADRLAALGLGHQIGTFLSLSPGEHAVVTLERWAVDGRHDPAMIDQFDGLRPHRARAALTSARLGLERARAAVATLEALGLPAAVLTGSRRVLAVNGLMDANPALIPGAHGRLILAHPAADALFREILEANGTAAGAHSVPLPGSAARAPGIVHMLPLFGAAHDILGGATLVVLTSLRAEDNVPDASLLPGLFDLTPREAGIASALAAGRSLQQAADESGLRISTARSYLEQILRKTGTNQQS